MRLRSKISSAIFNYKVSQFEDIAVVILVRTSLLWIDSCDSLCLQFANVLSYLTTAISQSPPNITL
jgi:hypothetical protein